MEKYVKIWYASGEIYEYEPKFFANMSVERLTKQLKNAKKVIKFEITYKGLQ